MANTTHATHWSVQRLHNLPCWVPIYNVLLIIDSIHIFKRLFTYEFSDISCFLKFKMYRYALSRYLGIPEKQILLCINLLCAGGCGTHCYQLDQRTESPRPQSNSHVLKRTNGMLDGGLRSISGKLLICALLSLLWLVFSSPSAD